MSESSECMHCGGSERYGHYGECTVTPMVPLNARVLVVKPAAGGLDFDRFVQAIHDMAARSGFDVVVGPDYTGDIVDDD